MRFTLSTGAGFFFHQQNQQYVYLSTLTCQKPHDTREYGKHHIEKNTWSFLIASAWVVLTPSFFQGKIRTTGLLGSPVIANRPPLRTLSSYLSWLVVEPTHLKPISHIGNLPQIGVIIKHIWNHHPVSVFHWFKLTIPDSFRIQNGRTVRCLFPYRLRLILLVNVGKFTRQPWIRHGWCHWPSKPHLSRHPTFMSAPTGRPRGQDLWRPQRENRWPYRKHHVVKARNIFMPKASWPEIFWCLLLWRWLFQGEDDLLWTPWLLPFADGKQHGALVKHLPDSSWNMTNTGSLEPVSWRSSTQRGH